MKSKEAEQILKNLHVRFGHQKVTQEALTFAIEAVGKVERLEKENNSTTPLWLPSENNEDYKDPNGLSIEAGGAEKLEICIRYKLQEENKNLKEKVEKVLENPDKWVRWCDEKMLSLNESLTEENKTLKAKVDKLKIAIEDYQQHCNIAFDQRDEAEKENKALRQNLKNSQDDFDKLTREVSALRKQAEGLPSCDACKQAVAKAIHKRMKGE